MKKKVLLGLAVLVLPLLLMGNAFASTVTVFNHTNFIYDGAACKPNNSSTKAGPAQPLDAKGSPTGQPIAVGASGPVQTYQQRFMLSINGFPVTQDGVKSSVYTIVMKSLAPGMVGPMLVAGKVC